MSDFMRGISLDVPSFDRLLGLMRQLLRHRGPFERYAVFVLVYYLSSTLAIPLWLRISDRLGKHRTVVLGIAWLSLWSAPIPLLGPGDYRVSITAPAGDPLAAEDVEVRLAFYDDEADPEAVAVRGFDPESGVQALVDE